MFPLLNENHGTGVSGSFKIVDPYSLPKARVSDPVTSHEAAVAVKPGNGALIRAIRTAASKDRVPATAFVIAARVEHVHPKRWDEGTIRSAIARAGLRAVDTEGSSPRSTPNRKIRCIRYSL